MAIRIPWDKHEAAILLDVCLAVIENKISRTDAVLKVSKTLREKAIKKGNNVAHHICMSFSPEDKINTERRNVLFKISSTFSFFCIDIY